MPKHANTIDPYTLIESADCVTIVIDNDSTIASFIRDRVLLYWYDVVNTYDLITWLNDHGFNFSAKSAYSDLQTWHYAR